MFADEALSVTMLALVAARLVTVPVVMPAVEMVASPVTLRLGVVSRLAPAAKLYVKLMLPLNLPMPVL